MELLSSLMLVILYIISVHILGQRTDSSAAGSIVFNQIYKFRQIDNSWINKDQLWYLENSLIYCWISEPSPIKILKVFTKTIIFIFDTLYPRPCT